MLRRLFQVLSHLPPSLRRPLVRAIVNGVLAYYARLTVTGLEHIPDGPVLFVGNHLSNADGLVLNQVLRHKRVVFVAGVKLKGTILTRLAMELVETIAVHPNTADKDAVKQAIDLLRSGRSVLVFPEGGRSRTGALIRGKAGAVVIARRARVPMVPVALQGTEQLLPIQDQDMGAERPRKARVQVRIGPPFRLEDLAQAAAGAEDERQALVDAIMGRVAALLDPEYRGVYAAAPRPAAGNFDG